MGKDKESEYEQQLKVIRAYRPAARDHLIYLLTDADMFSHLALVQEDRLDYGYKKFRKRMFEMDHLRLNKELEEEMGDALQYASVLCMKTERRG